MHKTSSNTVNTEESGLLNGASEGQMERRDVSPVDRDVPSISSPDPGSLTRKQQELEGSTLNTNAQNENKTLWMGAIHPNWTDTFLMNIFANTGLVGVKIMRNKNNRHALMFEVQNTANASLLEEQVAHRKGLVDDENVGIHVDRHRERETYKHAARVCFDRTVNEFADFGELLD